MAVERDGHAEGLPLQMRRPSIEHAQLPPAPAVAAGLPAQLRQHQGRWQQLPREDSHHYPRRGHSASGDPVSAAHLALGGRGTGHTGRARKGDGDSSGSEDTIICPDSDDWQENSFEHFMISVTDDSEVVESATLNNQEPHPEAPACTYCGTVFMPDAKCCWKCGKPCGEALDPAPLTNQAPRSLAEDRAPGPLKGRIASASASSRQNNAEYPANLGKTWYEKTRTPDESSRRTSPDASGFPQSDHVASTEIVNTTLKDCVLRCSAGDVRFLLRNRADPNEHFGEFDCNGRHFLHGSPLPVAVMRGRGDIVHELIRARANLESTYSFATGNCTVRWRASALFAAMPQGNTPMMRLLLASHADLNAKSSSGANILWQACYFGYEDIVAELLTRRADVDVAAQSHEDDRITHTPLHIAARKGYAGVVRQLIHARVDPQEHEEAASALCLMSPLDDAIELGHAEVVRHLVAGRAEILATVPPRRRMKVNRDCRRPIDHLFVRRSHEAVAAAAQGLRDAPGQVERLLHLADVERFISSPGMAPVHIVNAIFRSRIGAFQHMADEGSNRHTKIQYAYLQDSLSLYGHADIERPNTTVGLHSKSVVQVLGETKRSREIDFFIRELVPQEPRNSRDSLSSISVYQCLLPDVHHDIGVLFAISQTKATAALLGELPCQALIAAAWLRARFYWCIQFMIQAIFIIVLFVSVTLVGVDAEVASGNLTAVVGEEMEEADTAASMQALGMAMLFPWILEAVLFFIIIGGYIAEGFVWGMLQSTDVWLDLANVFSFFLSILFCQMASESSFRIVLTLALLGRWTKTLHMLCVIERPGLGMLPIITSMENTARLVPFWLILLVCIFVATQSFKLLGVDGPIWAAYSVGVVGDFNSGGYASAGGLRGGAGFALVAVSLIMTVTLMKVLVAVLSSSYEDACQNSYSEFLRRRARVAADCAAVEQGCRFLRDKLERIGRFLLAIAVGDEKLAHSSARNRLQHRRRPAHDHNAALEEGVADKGPVLAGNRYVWFSCRRSAPERKGAAQALTNQSPLPAPYQGDLQAELGALWQAQAQHRREINGSMKMISTSLQKMQLEARSLAPHRDVKPASDAPPSAARKAIGMQHAAQWQSPSSWAGSGSRTTTTQDSARRQSPLSWASACS